VIKSVKLFRWANCQEGVLGSQIIPYIVNRRPTLPHLNKLFLLSKFDRRRGNRLCLL